MPKGCLKMDYNKMAAIEHEMAKKFGEEVTRSPRANWDEELEKEYVEQTTELNNKLKDLITDKSYENKKGYLISKKLLNDRDQTENCPYCGTYRFHFNVEDDMCINKWGCCSNCYINFIEDREDKWNEGWRPEKNKKSNS